MEIREYLDKRGASPFETWFGKLETQAATRVTIAITRLGLGATSNVKAVGAGVSELRIDFGPGYRVYFGKDGNTVVILLAGGTKKRQQLDIEAARARWGDYKTRKKSEA